MKLIIYIFFFSSAAPKTSQDPDPEVRSDSSKVKRQEFIEVLQSSCLDKVRVCLQVEEWAVALFDFPGQTADDLSFHKGALIQVIEHIDAEWRRGRLEGRDGLYPAAFTQPCPGTTHTHIPVIKG